MTHDHRGVFRKGLASFGCNNFRAQFKITETKILSNHSVRVGEKNQNIHSIKVKLLIKKIGPYNHNNRRRIKSLLTSILRLDITPMLNNIVFKIFFFSLATTLVFLVSVFTAFVFMKIIEYLSSFVQVNTKKLYSFLSKKIPTLTLPF